MKVIAIGTPVLVNLYGRRVRGVLAKCYVNTSLSYRSKVELMYIVYAGFKYDEYGGVAYGESTAFSVPESFFERIDGKPNPNYRSETEEYRTLLGSKTVLNEFQMRLTFDGGLNLRPEILVDGKVINTEYAIDYPKLIKSISTDGEFDILTCGCGISGCAGIREGIKVSHSSPEITWHITDPRPERLFRFNEDQYFSSIVQFFHAANALEEVSYYRYDDTDMGPYGFGETQFEYCLRQLETLLDDSDFVMEVHSRHFH